MNEITINCQSSIRINASKIIYFDPYNIEKKRNDADLIFITHDHFDHLDFKSIKNILKPETIIIVPKSISEKVLTSKLPFKEIVEVIPNETYNILGYQFTTIPSYNLNKNFHPKENNYVGYLITIDNERVYVSGDMDNIEEARKVECDVALVPIGGTYTMDYQEAASLINTIKPKITIPTHYKTIVGNAESALNFQKLLKKEIKCLILY